MHPHAAADPVQCPVCSTPLKDSAERCPACDYPRPDAGWPRAEISDADRLFDVDAEAASPVELHLPRAIAPRISDGRIELGAPPSAPLEPDDSDLEEELLEFGEDSDPIGFALDREAAEAPASPRALRVRVVPAEGGRPDAPDVVVPLQAQPEEAGVPVATGAPLQRGAVYASRYRIDELLETHPRYRCYLAIQEPMVRRVQLTVLGSAEGEAQDDLEARFLREAAVLARHGHPNLGAVVDFGRAADGTCYLASELIYGFSLRELMDRGPVEPERLAGILLDLARGLAACHDVQILHRALWPAHVVLETGPGATEPMARLGGYGLGQAPIQLDVPPSAELAASLAPEVVQGGAAIPASDVYAFGALAAEALLGRPLFAGGPEEMLRAQVERAPEGLDALVDAAGPAAGLAALASECLHKDPNRRPINGAELVPRLEVLAANVRRRPLAPVGISWRVLLAAALAGALVPTVLLAGMGLWMARQPEPASVPAPAVMTPDLEEVVQAQAAAKVRDEVKSLREQIGALEDALADAVAMVTAPDEEEIPAPAPAPVARPAPPPRPAPAPAPARVVEPVRAPTPAARPELVEPEIGSEEGPTDPPAADPPPEVAEAEHSEPVEPPPPPPPHPAAGLVNGLWLGTASARDLALDLSVSPDGVVTGSARLKRGGEVSSAAVRGRIGEVEGGYQLELQVTQDGETTSYSGRLEDGVIQGRIAQAGRTRGRWKVSR